MRKYKAKTKDGEIELDYTQDEIVMLSQEGNTEAINELIDQKGGFDALNSKQKETVLQLVLGQKVIL